MTKNSVRKGLVLIGMPGAGKSTLGVLLAKELGMDFIDTDVAIQVREGKTLQQIMDDTDYLSLRKIEEAVLLATDASSKIVSTGGSAVYSEKAMAHLKRQALVIYLDVSLDVLKKRIKNYETRGIARRPDQSFADLFKERTALYKQYADISINCGNKNTEEVMGEILQSLNGR